jgi:hypothetical protein
MAEDRAVVAREEETPTEPSAEAASGGAKYEIAATAATFRTVFTTLPISIPQRHPDMCAGFIKPEFIHV